MNDPSIRERALAIRAGETREEQLKGLLGGEPTMRMPLKGRTVLGYTYGDTKSHGLMLLVFNFMKTQTVTDSVYVEIGPDGVVQRVTVPPARTLEWQFWPF